MKGCLKDRFINSAKAFGEKTAVSFFRGGKGESHVSYGELDSDSNRMANWFLTDGVKRGDRVILFFPKSLQLVVAHLALMKIGAICVPLNPGLRKPEMAYFIRDAEPAMILYGPEQEAVIKETARKIKRAVVHAHKPYPRIDFFRSASASAPSAKVEPTDPGLIIYTSGTTGKPKGAVLSQGNLIYDAANIINIWEIKESDVLCHALPLFHVHGLCFALHTCLMAGAHVLLLDRFSPGIVVDLLSRNKGKSVCTMFMGVPSMYGSMLDHVAGRRRDFKHMRLWASGSAPLLPNDFERIKAVFGQEPVEREGMSETGMNFSNPLRGKRKPNAIGLPLPGLEVKVVNPETMQNTAPGQTGEIWLKGPGVTPGYWRNPEETGKAFVNGWFRTGDLGRVDREGYYYLTDRIKHMIISGGENISPKEIESVINRLEGVKESAVVGIPDERWGEKVVAAVVIEPDSKLRAPRIQSHCREHLLGWKCPKQVVLVEALSKNTMGKTINEDVKKLFA